MDLIRAGQRHVSDFGWLKTCWLFSFSDYYDPQNVRFGALRVYNDDVVEPGTGFPTHPHEEMEILTLVLEGELTHEDSLGNKGVIRAGDVQRMSAGTGLTHSEFNRGRSPVHFHQVWIFPDSRGRKPSYDQKSFSAESWRNTLLPVASGQGFPGAVTFHTDATIYRCSLEPGQRVTHAAAAGRKVFLYVLRGAVEVDGTRVSENDQARIGTEGPLDLAAREPAEFILIDVPSREGRGAGIGRKA